MMAEPDHHKTGRVYQHVRSFERALFAYHSFINREDGVIPLARFLTSFFKENKQMGSRDRRAVSRYIYHYFRLGHASPDLDTLRRLVLAEFLCVEESALVEAEDPLLNERIHFPLEEKISWLEETTSFRLSEVFPWRSRLSDHLDHQAFSSQFFVQPELFLRIRRGMEHNVLTLLDRHGLTYRETGERALALPNGTAVEQIRDLKGLVEVQDLSSQRSLEDLKTGPGESWWDACAGAGGKSLLLLDFFPDVRLLVSDFRPSILRNLDERFDAAGVRQEYRRKIIDLTKETTPVLGDEQFDGILLDVPCSGSGTWGRTPEMLSLFNESSIAGFSGLQKAITDRVIRHLKPGKSLVYITCSVFAAENEEVVGHLLERQGLELISMEYKIGYNHKADTLFVAYLKKKS